MDANIKEGQIRKYGKGLKFNIQLFPAPVNSVPMDVV
jgi:hypothetical protein